MGTCASISKEVALTVDNWETTAYQYGGCAEPTAYFTARGPNASDDYIVGTWSWPYGAYCTSSSVVSEWYSYTVDVPSLWQDGTRLCNFWEPFPGKPCETIHD